MVNKKGPFGQKKPRSGLGSYKGKSQRTTFRKNNSEPIYQPSPSIPDFSSDSNFDTGSSGGDSFTGGGGDFGGGGSSSDF